MNYKPLCYYFYGGANSTERAAYMSSWGLLGLIPASIITGGVTIWNTFIGFLRRI